MLIIKILLYKKIIQSCILLFFTYDKSESTWNAPYIINANEVCGVQSFSFVNI